MQKQLFRFICLLFSLVSITSYAKNSEFPGRAQFPNIPVYELNQLSQDIANVVIVDARSRYEYETLRFKSSINIPVASKTFEQALIQLRAKTDKPIVFYCNGRTCFKSYIAVKKGQVAGVSNIFAFDAGVFEWAIAKPKYAVLLGESPIKKENLISVKKFKSHLLHHDRFSDKAFDLGSNSMVLDVRDKYQRAGIGFYPGKERWVSLDDTKKLEKFLAKAKKKNKTLFIYDEVGKQVKWLQYTIEKQGIKNYYFMKKGATAYYTAIMEKR